MSNLEARVKSVIQIVESAQVDFNKLAEIHGAVNFQREASFALQILKSNDYLAEAASVNPDAFKYAILNVASLGVTLNPAQPEAYLVPRRVNKLLKVVLDIGWRGLMNKAVESGAIEYAVAEVVRENDEFKTGSIGEKPVHTFDPFGDRGEIVGAYCAAKLPSGDFITVVMSKGQIREIAERSEAFKKNSGPWMTDLAEMMKKTVVRRASKSWPPGKSDRLAKAIQIDNEANPLLTEAVAPTDDRRSHNLEVMLEALKASGRTEDDLIAYVGKAFKHKITKLDELSDLEIMQLQAFLKTVKPIKKEIA